MHVWSNLDPALADNVAMQAADEIFVTPLFLPSDMDLKAVYAAVRNSVSSTAYVGMALYKARDPHKFRGDIEDLSSGLFNNQLEFTRVGSQYANLTGMGATYERMSLFMETTQKLDSRNLYAIAWASNHVSTQFAGLENDNTVVYYSFGTGKSQSSPQDWPDEIGADGFREGGVLYGTPCFTLVSKSGLRWLGR